MPDPFFSAWTGVRLVGYNPYGDNAHRKAADLAIPDQKYDPKAPTELTADVTELVKAWVSGKSPNNGLKLEMTGGYVNVGMKGFRLEITPE